MSAFVTLRITRLRGWPWPEKSYGLTPMFGEDGWCHKCGVPRRAQSGSLILQRKGMKSADGAWMPYWQYDVICLAQPLAHELSKDFSVDLRSVEWHGAPAGKAQQIVAPRTKTNWYDPKTLTKLTTKSHGSAGATCEECGQWRWMPLLPHELPAPKRDRSWNNLDVVASPEWFGDGLKAFRHVAMRRELAALIVSASPRDFYL
jgi:hypothetical protein